MHEYLLVEVALVGFLFQGKHADGGGRSRITSFSPVALQRSPKAKQELSLKPEAETLDLCTGLGASQPQPSWGPP